MVDWVFANLPKLLAAMIILVIGGVLFIGIPWLVWRAIRPEEPRRWFCVVIAVLRTWSLIAGLIVLSLAVNALQIEPLQLLVDDLIAWIPNVVVAGALLGIGYALVWGLALVGRGHLSPRLANVPGPRMVLQVLGFGLLGLVCYFAVSMALDQLGAYPSGRDIPAIVTLLVLLASFPIAWWISRQHDDGARGHSDNLVVDGEGRARTGQKCRRNARGHGTFHCREPQHLPYLG